MNFNDKVVLITGAAQGIGREYALNFASKGAFVAIADLNLEKAQNVLAEVVEAGGKGMAVKVDVSDELSAREMVKAIVDEAGRIDVLVNNASIFATIKMKPFDQITVKEWDTLMAVNCKGTWIVTKEVAPIMKEQNHGKIVNISSLSFMVGKTDYLHYTSSKAAIIGMTRCLAKELGDWNINVNAILPGATYTEVERETNTAAQTQAMINMMCFHRKQTPKDLAGPVMFFSSEYSDFITGQSLIVDGGMHFH